MKHKTVITIFILSFLLNLAWENVHAVLYQHYQGGEITEFILLRATLFDAIVITLIFWIIYKIHFLKNKLWWIIIISLLIAVGNELYALATNRWAYTSAMPIIPLLTTGLSPTIQLATIALIVYFITKKFSREKPTLIT